MEELLAAVARLVLVLLVWPGDGCRKQLLVADQVGGRRDRGRDGRRDRGDGNGGQRVIALTGRQSDGRKPRHEGGDEYSAAGTQLHRPIPSPPMIPGAYNSVRRKDSIGRAASALDDRRLRPTTIRGG